MPQVTRGGNNDIKKRVVQGLCLLTRTTQTAFEARTKTFDKLDHRAREKTKWGTAVWVSCFWARRSVIAAVVA